MTYQLKYGSYTFPKGLYPSDNNLPSIVPQSKRVRADGGRLLPATLSAKQITIKGGIVAPVGTSARPIVDGMKAAIFGQGPANLTFQADRYWRNVVCRDFKDGHPGTHYDRIDDIEIDLITGDPFQYEVATNTLALTPASTTVSGTATAGGNAYSKPVISFTAATINLALNLYNDSTSESFSLTGSVLVGAVVVVDCLAETVTIAGVDRMDLFEGLFPRLQAGANTIRAVYVSGALTSISAGWQNRWY
jgi:phage-related protein